MFSLILLYGRRRKTISVACGEIINRRAVVAADQYDAGYISPLADF